MPGSGWAAGPGPGACAGAGAAGSAGDCCTGESPEEVAPLELVLLVGTVELAGLVEPVDCVEVGGAELVSF